VCNGDGTTQNGHVGLNQISILFCESGDLWPAQSA
jgi:hypothetical protein